MQKQHADHTDDPKWHAILHASQVLLDAAKEARWDELADYAKQRDQLIRDYFSRPITVDNALQLHDEITQLLAMDEQVLGLARKEKTNTATALKGMASGKKAVAAYQQQAR